MRQILFMIGSFWVLCTLSACGTAELPSSTSHSGGRSGDILADRTERVDPPIGYYEALMADQLNAVFGRNEIEVNYERNLYLNFGGGTVTKGFGASQSFLPCDTTVSVPAAQYSEADIEKIMISVTTYFAQLDSSLKISQEPLTGKESSTVYVGGVFEDLGCGLANLQYHAPLDKENANQHDVAFVFSNSIGNLDEAVTQIENAIESIYGLEGQLPLNKVESVVDEAELTGLDEIHSISRLLWELDDANVADISFLNAELNALIPGGAKNIQGFERTVSVLIGVSSQSQTSGQNQSGGGLADWLGGILGAGNTSGGTGGGGTDILTAVAVLSGHPEIAMAAQALGQVTQAANASAGAANEAATGDQNASQLPNLAELISINGQGSYNKMIGNMKGHAKFVEREYDGKTKEALNALLVVAYSQSFRAYFSGTVPADVEQENE